MENAYRFINKLIISALVMCLLGLSIPAISQAETYPFQDLLAGTVTYTKNYFPNMQAKYKKLSDDTHKKYKEKEKLLLNNEGLLTTNKYLRDQAKNEYTINVIQRDNSYDDYERQKKISDKYYKNFQVYRDRAKADAKSAADYKRASDQALKDYFRQVDMAEEAEKDRKRQKKIADDHYSLYLIYIDINRTTANTHYALYVKHKGYASNYAERRDKHYGYADNYYGMHTVNQRNYDGSKLNQWENEEKSDANYRSYLTHNGYANNYKKSYEIYKKLAQTFKNNHTKYVNLVKKYQDLVNKFEKEALDLLVSYSNHQAEAKTFGGFIPKTQNWLDKIKDFANNLFKELNTKCNDNSSLECRYHNAALKQHRGETLTTAEKKAIEDYNRELFDMIAGMSGGVQFIRAKAADPLLKLVDSTKGIIINRALALLGKASKEPIEHPVLIDPASGKLKLFIPYSANNLDELSLAYLQTTGIKSNALKANKIIDIDKLKYAYNYEPRILNRNANMDFLHGPDPYIHGRLDYSTALNEAIKNETKTYKAIIELHIPLSEISNKALVASNELKYLGHGTLVTRDNKTIWGTVSYLWHIPGSHVEKVYQ